MIGELAKMTYTCPHLEHSSLMRAPNGPEPVLVLYGGDMQIHTHCFEYAVFVGGDLLFPLRIKGRRSGQVTFASFQGFSLYTDVFEQHY